MEKTFEQILDFNAFANDYLSKNKGESKLSYAVKKVQKKLAKTIEEYVDKIKDLEIDKASVDKEGNLLIKDNKYQYTKDNLKELNKAKKELYESSIVEVYNVDSHIVEYIDEYELTLEQKEIFEGFVL